MKSSVFYPAQQFLYNDLRISFKYNIRLDILVSFGPAKNYWAGAGPDENTFLSFKINNFNLLGPAAQQFYYSMGEETFSHRVEHGVCETSTDPLYKNCWAAGPKSTKIFYQSLFYNTFSLHDLDFCWAGAGPVLGRNLTKYI